MKHRVLFSFAAIAVALSAAACGVEPHDGESNPSEEAAGELRESSEGATLSSNDGLKARFEMLDGAKARNKNRRYTKATFTRDRKSLVLWCDAQAGAKVGTAEPWVEIECTKNVSTVSHDDDESITFKLVRRGAKVTGEIEYAGDGTFLGDEYRLLAGTNARGSTAKLDLTFDTNPDKVDKNPFTLLDRVATATRAMIGKRAHIVDEDENLDVRAKLDELTAHLDDKMEVSFFYSFHRVDPPTDETRDGKVSLLATRGTLASGVVSESMIEERFLSALKLE